MILETHHAVGVFLSFESVSVFINMNALNATIHVQNNPAASLPLIH